VAPDRFHHAALAVRDMRGFVLSVYRGEITIQFHRQDDRSGFDAPERCFEIALENLVVANVAGSPGPKLGEEIVGIAAQEERLPKLRYMAIPTARAELSPRFGTEERLRRTPSCIDAANACSPRTGGRS
jgi:hypothetical protein